MYRVFEVELLCNRIRTIIYFQICCKKLLQNVTESRVQLQTLLLYHMIPLKFGTESSKTSTINVQATEGSGKYTDVDGENLWTKINIQLLVW